ncbi:MAG: hypothetical protein J6M05_03305 [Cardiobacteriaceae bacterium]|nr:hypothetical protein [Cardiobacteriaceae bacterium]
MNTKHRKLFLTVNAVLASLASSAYAAVTIPDVNVDPLIVESKQVSPAVVLALSVEYPTAGIAYSTTNILSKEGLKKKYLGYFDNRAHLKIQKFF